MTALTRFVVVLLVAAGAASAADAQIRRIIDRARSAVSGPTSLPTGETAVDYARLMNNRFFPARGSGTSRHSDQAKGPPVSGGPFVSWGRAGNIAQPADHTLSVISGTASKMSATRPKSATWKIGASSSLLIATMIFESFIPARCWIAPEMPQAM